MEQRWSNMCQEFSSIKKSQESAVWFRLANSRVFVKVHSGRKETYLPFSFQAPWPGSTRKVMYLNSTGKLWTHKSGFTVLSWGCKLHFSHQSRFLHGMTSQGWRAWETAPPQTQCRWMLSVLFFNLFYFHFTLPFPSLLLCNISKWSYFIFILFSQVLWQFVRFLHPFFGVLYIIPMHNPRTSPGIANSFSFSLSSPYPLFLFFNHHFPLL